jgi:exodeoxyribonuclease VII small subunit
MTADPTLETRLARLEEIATTLEGDRLELEDALALFEEGVGHLRAAREILARAALRIERLVRDLDGGLLREPLEPGR